MFPELHKMNAPKFPFKKEGEDFLNKKEPVQKAENPVGVA